jgi:hypothetical protein
MRLALLLCLASLSACAAGSPRPQPQAVSLRLPGFSAEAPAAPGWILTPGSSSAQAAVRSLGDSRTLVAYASEEGLRERAGGKMEEALDRALADIRAGYESGRHRLRSFETGEEDAGCREYRLTSEDAGVPDRAGRLYVVTARGKVCVIAERNLVARLEYSDRRVESEPPLPSFDEEAEAFLASLAVADSAR